MIETTENKRFLDGNNSKNPTSTAYLFGSEYFFDLAQLLK